jgi:hypothetical protein
MLTIIAILLILWLLGLLGGVGSHFVHILLAVALAIWIIDRLQSRGELR